MISIFYPLKVSGFFNRINTGYDSNIFNRPLSDFKLNTLYKIKFWKNVESLILLNFDICYAEYRESIVLDMSVFL